MRQQEEALAGYAEAMKCHLGDFTEYAALRRRISDREAELSRRSSRDSRAAALASLERLRRGDVVRVQAGRRAGWAVVVDPGAPGGADGPRPTVLTADRQLHRLSLAEVPAPLEPLTRVNVPKSFNSRNPAARRDLASTLRNVLGAAADDVPRPSRHRSRSGGGRGARDLAQAAAGAPVPRLLRPGGPRPLGAALVAPAPRDRAAHPPHRGPHQHHRAGLRPGL